MKALTVIASGLLLVMCLAGCNLLEKRPIQARQIDRYWYLEPNTWDQAKALRWELAGHPLPTKFTLLRRQTVPPVIASLVRCGYQLMEGTETVQLGLTSEQARAGADLLHKARLTMLDLKDSAPGTFDEARWSVSVAKALVVAEEMSRSLGDLSSCEASSRFGQQLRGYERLLQTLAGQMNGQGIGAIGQPGQTGRSVGDIMTEGVLRISFAMAQKKAPPAATTRIREQFALASKPALAQAKVRDILRQSLREAPPAEPSASSQTVQSALSWGPVVLGLMEDFDRQWDKVRSVTVEVRKDGSQTLVGLTIQVEPGRQVELHSWPMPTLVFAGTCRIVIQPTYDPTRQAVVLFDSPEGGSCRLRFNGLIYAVARLVLPLEDATVREIRLARSSTYRGPNLASAEVLLDTGQSRSDARRMFVYQTAQVHRPQRQAVSIREISSDRRDSFTYVTPHMLYTYEYPRPIGK